MAARAKPFFFRLYCMFVPGIASALMIILAGPADASGWQLGDPEHPDGNRLIAQSPAPASEGKAKPEPRKKETVGARRDTTVELICPSGAAADPDEIACWQDCPPGFALTPNGAGKPGMHCKREAKAITQAASLSPAKRCPKGSAPMRIKNATICGDCSKGMTYGQNGCAKPGQSRTGPFTPPRKRGDLCPNGAHLANGKCLTCPPNFVFNPKSASPETGCRLINKQTKVAARKLKDLRCRRGLWVHVDDKAAPKSSGRKEPIRVLKCMRCPKGYVLRDAKVCALTEPETYEQAVTADTLKPSDYETGRIYYQH